ncbi:hypothetical protein KCU99_g63, partial [Aureobasidium melanogenum]
MHLIACSCDLWVISIEAITDSLKHAIMPLELVNKHKQDGATCTYQHPFPPSLHLRKVSSTNRLSVKLWWLCKCGPVSHSESGRAVHVEPRPAKASAPCSLLTVLNPPSERLGT